MKRMLFVTLFAAFFASNVLAQQYIATYINPTRLMGFQEQQVSGGILEVPAFLGQAQVGRTKTGKIDTRQVVHTQVDLGKLTLPQTTDKYSITKTMENGDPVFHVCIIKSLIPGFDPSKGVAVSPEQNVWGFKNYASVEEQDDMWCFTLKNNQGYIKK